MKMREINENTPLGDASDIRGEMVADQLPRWAYDQLSASPDLLEELEALTGELERMGFHDMPGDTNADLRNRYDSAMIAIAKTRPTADDLAPAMEATDGDIKLVEPDDKWAVDYVDPQGWRVLGPDNNGVQVVAEPGVYFATHEESLDALVLYKASAAVAETVSAPCYPPYTPIGG